MIIKPKAYNRGDTLDKIDGKLVATIGALSEACISGEQVKTPLDILLLEGSHQVGFEIAAADEHHHVYAGKVTESKISFTLESFEVTGEGNPWPEIKKDSATFQSALKGDLRTGIFDVASKQNIQGALLYIKGVAKDIKTWGHSDVHHLNDETKVIDHVKGLVEVEGWGNLTFIDGETPFVHMHGHYHTQTTHLGGHFIMDEETPFLLEKTQLLIYPVSKLIRTDQGEDFPTWKV
jgi:predicted DNA-binding protein with PD1-like motif